MLRDSWRRRKSPPAAARIQGCALLCGCGKICSCRGEHTVRPNDQEADPRGGRKRARSNSGLISILRQQQAGRAAGKDPALAERGAETGSSAAKRIRQRLRDPKGPSPDRLIHVSLGQARRPGYERVGACQFQINRFGKVSLPLCRLDVAVGEAWPTRSLKC